MATSSPSIYRDLHLLIKDMDYQYMLFMDITDMDTDTCHTDILCQKGKLKLRPKLRLNLRQIQLSCTVPTMVMV